MPRFEPSNVTRMTKTSHLHRRMTYHGLSTAKNSLEECRLRAARYTSDKAIVRLAAALPCPPVAGEEEELEPTGKDKSSTECSSKDAASVTRIDGGSPKDGQSKVVGNEPPEKASTSTAGTSTGSSSTPPPPPPPASPRPPPATLSSKPRLLVPRKPQSLPEFLEKYSKKVFGHVSASQSWILCNNLKYYMDVLDAAKFHATAYSPAWEGLRHRFLSVEEVSKYHPPAREYVLPKPARGICITVQQADDIIATYMPYIPGSDDSEDSNEDTPPSTGSESSESPSSIESSNRVQSSSSTPELEDEDTSENETDNESPARKRLLRQLNGLDAMVFRRLVEEFYRLGERARPFTFAHMMKLHLGLSRVSHQYQQQHFSINTIGRSRKVHPNRERRAQMSHDAAIVMKSQGLSSPLSESISAKDEWPDEWDIGPVKRRKIHGRGVRLPGMTAKTKASAEAGAEEAYPTQVDW